LETSGLSLLCRVGASVGVLPLAATVETYRPLPVEPVAGSPPFVLGVAVVRGAALPVVDLTRLVTGRPGRPTRFVTVKARERHVALAVDAVIGVRPLPKQWLHSLPPLLSASDGETVVAVGTLDAELAMVLETSRLAAGDVFSAEIERRAS